MPEKQARKRRTISASLKREVLAESGYRCAVPTCRGILALDLHHIIEVEEGGPTTLLNLLALCPTCHALYTRGISDGVLHFSHLIAADLARYQLVPQYDLLVTYVVQLTSKGLQMIDAWFSGNREEIKQALNDLAKRQ